jgi:cytidine deaminase
MALCGRQEDGWEGLLAEKGAVARPCGTCRNGISSVGRGTAACRRAESLGSVRLYNMVEYLIIW